MLSPLFEVLLVLSFDFHSVQFSAEKEAEEITFPGSMGHDCGCDGIKLKPDTVLAMDEDNQYLARE